MKFYIISALLLAIHEIKKIVAICKERQDNLGKKTNERGEQLMDQQINYCPRCKEQVTAEHRFCQKCGLLLSQYNSQPKKAEDQKTPTSAQAQKERKYYSYSREPQADKPTATRKKFFEVLGIIAVLIVMAIAGVIGKQCGRAIVKPSKPTPQQIEKH
jgi:predicted amidophosphoribosyltransferase